MACCRHCRDAGEYFDEKTAQRDLKRYKKRGPNKSTRLMLNAIEAAGGPSESLLDIGAGIGAIQLELFSNGLQKATNIDASASYLQASKREAARRGLRDQTDYHYGDVVDLSSELADADIVTLDRVICCYPDPEKLIRSTAPKAKNLFGVVYPRERMLSRVGLWLGNQWFRMSGREFRTYLFASDRIDQLIKRQGFTCYRWERTFLWHVVVYRRM